MIEGYTLHNIEQFVGQELGVSEWMRITQERINQFAVCTGDYQWIHVDVARAKRESPLGSTIAHGYLTLALLTGLQMEIGIVPAGVSQVFNYGLDRVRFIAPVKADACIRNRVKLLSADKKEKGRILLRTQNVIEIEGEEKPALIADSLAMLIVEDNHE